MSPPPVSLILLRTRSIPLELRFQTTPPAHLGEPSPDTPSHLAFQMDFHLIQQPGQSLELQQLSLLRRLTPSRVLIRVDPPQTHFPSRLMTWLPRVFPIQLAPLFTLWARPSRIIIHPRA